MIQLTIRFLKLTVTTDAGDYGCSVEFSDGLNVIRAENNSGKSTLLNSICYALGLEAILGRSGALSLKPAMRTALQFDNKIHTVLESYVELECSNQKGEVITVKRQVVGNQDDRLIVVNRGSRLSNIREARAYVDEFYFVRDPGAAQRENGFHYFLARFLGLEVPVVETYDGVEVPLYLECIFPLFFIEQKRGWSNIQATIPTRYRIRNVSKAAMEHVLGLDVTENEKKKTSIELDKAKLKAKWSGYFTSLSFIARDVGGVLNAFPPNPVAGLDADNLPYVAVLDADQWFSLDDWIVDIRDRLIRTKSILEMSEEQSEDKNDGLRSQLALLEEQLLFQEAALAEAADEYYKEETDRNLLAERLKGLASDLVKNQDALKLQRFGANLRTAIASGECPTCHQAILDTLLAQPASQVPMSIDLNIEFIKEQKRAAQLFLAQSERLLSAKNLALHNRREVSDDTRQRIQDIKSNLTITRGIPDISLVRDVISSEEKLKRSEEAREKLNSILAEVEALAEQWKLLLSEESNLPKDFFSALDKSKLATFSDLFRDNVSKFGFTSVSPSLIHISPDSYRPTIEGFEISFDASASDNIRIIWAYTLALQELADVFDTHHWRICLFDEPGQQQVNRASREAFYKKAGALPPNHQVFATTSERPENLLSFLQNVKHQMIEFGTEVLKPV